MDEETTDKNLRAQIENSRSKLIDNSLVTYDLTTGVDFSHPRKTAHSLAEVFFEEDAKYWFTIEGDKLKFKPGYKAEIVLTKEHDRKVKATLNDFLNDLKDDEIMNVFTKQVKESSEVTHGISAYILLGIASLYLTTITNNVLSQVADRDRYLHDLLLKIMSNTTIRYLD